MPDHSPSILVVTPVWKDSSRLAIYGETLATAFAASPLPIQWIIADDGSIGDEPEKLKTLQQKFAATFPNVRLHFANAHRGKGSVVREAWALAPDADLLAFVDADGSLSAPHLLDLIQHAIDQDKSVLAIRKRTATTQIVESAWRSIFHHGFLLAAHLILGLRCEDPQCGAKILKGTDYRSIAHQLIEDGLAFDSELLATLDHNGADWLEVPVTWIEKKGGKIRPLIDGWSMLLALVRIRLRLE